MGAAGRRANRPNWGLCLAVNGEPPAAAAATSPWTDIPAGTLPCQGIGRRVWPVERCSWLAPPPATPGSDWPEIPPSLEQLWVTPLVTGTLLLPLIQVSRGPGGLGPPQTCFALGPIVPKAGPGYWLCMRERERERSWFIYCNATESWVGFEQLMLEMCDIPGLPERTSAPHKYSLNFTAQ